MHTVWVCLFLQVRAIGISNMPSALAGFLLASARIKPHVHQFEAHPQLPQVSLHLKSTRLKTFISNSSIPNLLSILK